MTWCALMCASPSLLAQQGKGLFFSAFGLDAPVSYGRFSTYQAFYFEVPETESKTVYLRVFDADAGGNYDEKHGNFNTSTRFIVLGGRSAGSLYGGMPEIETAQPEWASSDVLYDKTFSESRSADGKWISLRELPLQKGFQNNGFSRFVLLVVSGKGDDSNFFDLALSYDKNAKTQVPGSKAWVYSLSLRNPSLLAYAWESFQGQLVFQAPPGEPLELYTFDMDDVPITVELGAEPIQGETSGDGVWIGNKLDSPESGTVRFNFYGRDFNNTFGFVVLNKDRQPVPLFLPIQDYLPNREIGPLVSDNRVEAPSARKPEEKPVEQKPSKKEKEERKPVRDQQETAPPMAIQRDYAAGDCFSVTLKADMGRYKALQNAKFTWLFKDRIFTGTQISVNFDSVGYKPFKLQITGLEEGRPRTFEVRDSVLVNRPPVAWAGANRVTVPGKYIVFDGTVSEDPDGRITRYEWDLGDGTRINGARVDHIYKKSGTYEIRLKIRDDSGTPCSDAEALASVHVNESPVAKIIGPSFVEYGETFVLDGSESRDPDGSIIDYLWEIGSDTTLSGPRVEYALRNGGTVPVTLTVRDNSDVSNSIARAKMTIRSNRAPIANAGDDKRVSPGKPATYSAGRSYDPDGSISTYEWDFGDGKVYTASTVNYAFENPGRYSVKLKVTDNTGRATATDSLSVWVNEPPVPVITGNTVLADGRLMLSAEGSSDGDGEIVGYEWSVGDGRSFGGPELNTYLRNPGRYTVRLTVSDDSKTASSVQTAEVEVVVNRLPEAVISAPFKVSPGEENEFSGAKSNDADGNVQSWEWDFGDGTVANGPDVKHTYSKPGLYQVQLKVKDDSGLDAGFDVITHEVRVNAPPVIVEELLDNLKPNQSFKVDLSQSYDPEGRKLQFSWRIDGQWRNGGAVREFRLNSGSDSVLVSADDGEGIKSSRSQKWIVFRANRRPFAKASPKSIRTDRFSVFLNSAGSTDADGDPLKIYWDFGDGNFAEGAALSHTYQYGGRFKAVLTVDDQRGQDNSQATDTVDIFINRPPTAYFEFPDIICVGAPVAYSGDQAQDPDEDRLSYRWSFGEGSTSSARDGSIVFRQEGKFQVILTVDDGNGLPNSMVSYSRTIVAIGAPVADAGPDRTICRTEILDFDAGASRFSPEIVLDADWDFGDGKKGFGMQESHRYTNPGVYTVTLTLKSRGAAGCELVSTDQLLVTVLPELKADFSVPDFVALGDTLSLDPSASLQNHYEIRSFVWNVDDREFLRWDLREDGKGPNKTYWSATGIKAGTGSATAPNLTATGKLPVSKMLLPGGEHRLELVITARSNSNCNEARKAVSVMVQGRPDVAIAEVPVLAPKAPFMFSVKESSGRVAQLSGADWDFGDGKTASGFYVSHAFAEPGKYKVTMTAKMGRNRVSTYKLTRDVLVNAPPAVVFDLPPYAYLNVPLALNASGTTDADGKITSVSWSVSDGAKYTGTTASHTFTKKGVATVTLTVKDDSPASNGTATVTKQIIVAEAPSFTLNLDGQYCVGSPINLLRAASFTDADSLKARFFIGDRPISFAQARAFTVQFPGVYSVRIEPAGTASIGGGPTLAGVRKQIVVNAPPQIYTDVPLTINLNMANANALFDCAKSFDPNGDVVNAVWDMGDGNRKPGKTIRHLYKNPGTYRVMLTVSDDRNQSCSTSRQEFTVKVIRE